MNKSLLLFILFASTTAFSFAQTPVCKKKSNSEYYCDIRPSNDATFIVSGKATAVSNKQSTPTISLEILVDGSSCDSQETPWQDGPHAIEAQCIVDLKGKETHRIVAKANNSNAVASGISLVVKPHK